MAAFAAAIEAGHGIECDVRVSRDGVAFVFHDADLGRMTGRDGSVEGLAAAALDRMRLPDGGPVPRLSALLALCGGRVPLLIEAKARGWTVGPLCRAVAAELIGWNDAPIGLMSFNPWAVWRLREQRAGQLFGLVVTRRGKRRLRGAIERRLALWMANPDFLACDICDLPSRLSRQARARGMPVLTWTVRSDAERARAAAYADQIIHEAPHD